MVPGLVREREEGQNLRMPSTPRSPLAFTVAGLLCFITGGPGCKAYSAHRYLKIEDLRLVEGEGGVLLPVAPHAAVNVGKSLYVTGRVANRHPDRAATHVELLVKLYRHDTSRKAKHEYILRDVEGLGRLAPGGTGAFQVHLKETLRGYERVEADILSADFVH